MSLFKRLNRQLEIIKSMTIKQILRERGGEKMKRKGQSTLEYAVIIAVVVGALLAMQAYMKRGVEGKLRGSADSIGEQYSAGNMTSKYTTEQKSALKTKETFGLSSGDGTTFDQGVSYYTIGTKAEVARTAQGNDAEKVTEDLKDEKLVE